MIELSTIRDLVAIFGVIAGFSYYVITVGNQNRTRKTQTTLMLRLEYKDEGRIVNLLSMNWTDYEDFLRKYDSTVNPENYQTRWHVWSYYETMGYMLHQNLLELDSIYYVLNGYGVLQLWNKFKPVIYGHRERYNEPFWFKWFEYLAEEVMKYRVKLGLPENITDIDEYPQN